MKLFEIGDRRMVGDYQLIAELGQGAMGRVFLGLSSEDGLVALKEVHPNLVNDPQFRMRFSREVKAARRVTGDHTMAVVGADPGAAVPWLASTFAPGLSLDRALEAGGAFTEQSAMRLGLGLAKALIDIKEAKLVHRDLKPSNIMLTEDGPRVIDFGIARAADGATLASLNDLTRTKQVVGTAPFMSPEQAESRPLTAASDIFSLGSVLATAVTGKPLFSAPSEVQILYKIVHGEPDLTPLPLTLRGIVQACLAKDPKQRPTAEEIVESLSLIHPTIRPWSAKVHSLIDAQSAQVAGQVKLASKWPTRLASGGTKLAVSETKTTPESTAPLAKTKKLDDGSADGASVFPPLSLREWERPELSFREDVPKLTTKDSETSTSVVVVLLALVAIVGLAIMAAADASPDDSTTSNNSAAGDLAATDVSEDDYGNGYTTPEPEETTEAADHTLQVCDTAADTIETYRVSLPSPLTAENLDEAADIMRELSAELYNESGYTNESKVRSAIEVLASDFAYYADAFEGENSSSVDVALGWIDDDLDNFNNVCYGV